MDILWNIILQDVNRYNKEYLRRIFYIGFFMLAFHIYSLLTYIANLPVQDLVC